jgi:hypothetical protein
MPEFYRMPTGSATPRHDETDKGVIERAIFSEFAARYRADIDISSVRSGDPLVLEPDIIAKSTESDAPVACELVRLTEEESQSMIRSAQGAVTPTVSATGNPVTPLSIDAFSRKFGKARQGLYSGVHASQLELLAYSDHLLTPWPQVLQALTYWLTTSPREGFTRAWLWHRGSRTDDAAQGLWLWEAGCAVQPFSPTPPSITSSALPSAASRPSRA